MITMKKLLVLLLAVGIFSYSATGQRDKCTYGRHEFNVGDVIERFTNSCEQLVCRPGNRIERDQPLGRFARRCCVCHNKLFERSTKTCKEFLLTGRCPVQCNVNGRELGHGEVLDTSLATCSRRRCLNGQITQEQSLGKGLTGCCLTKNKMAAPGIVKSDGGCVPETCQNSAWVPSSSSIIDTCAKCRAFTDPHFIVFSGAIFDWHIGCNHALVQEGSSRVPEFGVFMNFDRRGTIGYVGGPTTYQEDIDTKVVLYPRSNQVTVNGQAQEITSSHPIYLVGLGFTRTTAIAWKHGSCIRLYGKPKILVELCGNAITIWAPLWSFGQKPLAGLCGSTNKDEMQDRHLVDRNGDLHPNPAAYKLAPAAFGYDWQAASQTKVGCPDTGGGHRRRRTPDYVLDAKEIEDEKKRKECVDVSKSLYMPQCLEVVKGAGLTEAAHDLLLNACLYDCCIVANDTEAGITVEDMLQQHQEVAAETKDQEDNTIEFVPSETKCPAEWSPVGRQCYQVLPFNESNNIDDATQFHNIVTKLEGDEKLAIIARQNCINLGATLAQPRDINATNNFLQGALLTLPRKYTGVGFECLFDGGVICRMPGYICEKEPIACGDEDDDCAWRAADGECDGNRPYMFTFCKASCKVPCECDQPDTCTVVGGMCQPLSANCNEVSDPTLCSGDNCTCCYVPDPCQDAEDQDCQSYAMEGYCEAMETYILEEMMKYCSLTCGFCEPRY